MGTPTLIAEFETRLSIRLLTAWTVNSELGYLAATSHDQRSANCKSECTSYWEECMSPVGKCSLVVVANLASLIQCPCNAGISVSLD